MHRINCPFMCGVGMMIMIACKTAFMAVRRRECDSFHLQQLGQLHAVMLVDVLTMKQVA